MSIRWSRFPKKGVAEFEATPDYHGKMGLTPAQFIDLKALMGDKSDNIPGEKTGIKLLLEHGLLRVVMRKYRWD